MTEMDAPTPKKTITLANWIDALPDWSYAAVQRVGDRYSAQLIDLTVFDPAETGTSHYVEGDTPEDALQALAEATCGPDTLLDIPRSAKWREAHGPDGVDELEKDAADWRAIREAMHAARGCIGAMPTAQEFLTEYGHCYERARAVENARRRLEQTLGGVGDDATAGNLATARAQEQYFRMQHPGIFADPETPAGHEVRPIETSMEEENETDELSD